MTSDARRMQCKVEFFSFLSVSVSVSTVGEGVYTWER